MFANHNKFILHRQTEKGNLTVHLSLNFELWTLLMCQTIISILYTVFQIGTQIYKYMTE
jgi:hypothetical protein